LGGSFVISFPSKTTFPLSGCSNPPMILRVVVLPQPLGPNNVRNSFSLIYRFNSSRIKLSPYDFEISTKSISLFAISKFLSGLSMPQQILLIN
jgi:hypothetical protein